MPRQSVSRIGFTLVELLVAISLVAVVGTLALLLLNSTRQIAEEVEDRPPRFDSDLLALEDELLQMLPSPESDDWPSFALAEGQILQFSTLVSLGNGALVPVASRYEPDGQDTLHVQESPYLPQNRTNRIENLRSPMEFEVLLEKTWHKDWPMERAGGPEGAPQLLRARRYFPDGSISTRYLPIPGHAKVEREDTPEEENATRP